MYRAVHKLRICSLGIRTSMYVYIYVLLACFLTSWAVSNVCTDALQYSSTHANVACVLYVYIHTCIGTLHNYAYDTSVAHALDCENCNFFRVLILCENV
jgi:uncharacterized membrane protein